jgi:D-inositol-3-phosphate glycosyltransferase
VNEVPDDSRSSSRRVLLVSHYFPPHVGGIENVVQAEAAHLSRLGHDVTVFTTAVNSDPGRRRLPEGYNVVRLKAWNGIERGMGIPFPVPTPWFLVKAASLVRAADVVHVHDALYMTSWMAAGIARLLGRPIVLTQHVQLVAHAPIVEAVQRIVYASFGRYVVRSASRIVYVNAKVAEFLKRLGALNERLTFIANGVDTDTFQPVDHYQKQQIRRAFGLPDANILALFVGRFVPKKGYCKLLQATSVRYSLVMVGGPPPEGSENLHGIIFLGTRSPKQVAELYRSCDIFVLPSESEGFPLTLQEAMASGLPIITSDDPGYDVYGLDRDLVAMIQPTVSHIRSALERVADDENLRRRMAEYSLHVAMTSFPWSEHVRKLERIYSDLCSKQSGAHP